ncbi:MAG: DivIVA domain-containing protein [Ruminococcus sp.]|nr:DivIVA domain-containing protein [Ruminococcus sp.]
MGLFNTKNTGVKLKKLSREELVEIIYALQQSEKSLKEENEELKARIAENEQVISHFGTVADASQSLNDIFSEAQKALEQYLMAIKVTAAGTTTAGSSYPSGVDVQLAQYQAEEIVAEANRQADEILAEARREVDKALELVRQAGDLYTEENQS